MKLLRKRDVPEEKYANAFLGFGPETSNFVVELTYSMLHCKPFYVHACSVSYVYCDSLILYTFAYHLLCV
jgi:hypothetical protein